jgi:hypothetical protein
MSPSNHEPSLDGIGMIRQFSLRRPSLSEALQRWQEAAGPYWMYVCAAPFVSAPSDLAQVEPSPANLALQTMLSSLTDEPGSAVFLDLPPAVTLPATGACNQLGLVVAPVIQRWIASTAVLPSEQLAMDLTTFAMEAMPPGPASGVVFLLDGDRAGPGHETQLDGPGRPATQPIGLPELFDNRYSYPVCRFPAPAFLQREGIERVHWVADSGVAADLREYVHALEEVGLSLTLMTTSTSVSGLSHASPA